MRWGSPPCWFHAALKRARSVKIDQTCKTCTYTLYAPMPPGSNLLRRRVAVAAAVVRSHRSHSDNHRQLCRPQCAVVWLQDDRPRIADRTNARAIFSHLIESVISRFFLGWVKNHRRACGARSRALTARAPRCRPCLVASSSCK